MTKKEYEEKVKELNEKRLEIANELEQLKEKYGIELMKRNGYKIGDIVKMKDGTDAIVAGYETIGTNMFYLKCNKIKKDGTPSQVSAGYLGIRLKED